MTLEVATIQREQIEGVQEHVGIIAAVSELLKHRQPGVVAGDRLAVPIKGLAAVIFFSKQQDKTTGQQAEFSSRISNHWGPKMPAFVPPPNQFSPKRGPHANDEIDLLGCEVTLFGTGFDAGDLSVKFGEVEATSIISRTSTEIRVNVPAMEGPRAVQITVRTGGGTTTSDEEFRVSPLPIVEELNGMQFADMVDPSLTTFRILGLHFIAEDGDTVDARCVFPELAEFIRLDVLSVKTTVISVQWPDVPNHHRFIGVQAFMKVERSDGGLGQLEFEIKGL